MSNVIKGFDLTLCEPMVIKPLSEPVESILPQEKETHDDMQQTRRDVEAVLAEAEKMVRDLLDQARKEASGILNNSREEAEVLVRNAEQEAGSIRERARQEGYEEGLRKAQSESESDRQMAMEQCQEILEEARRSKIKIMESSTADMARLVIAVVKKIVATELVTNPQIIIHVIREAISFLDQPGKVLVYVNPQEMEQVLAGISDDTFREVGSHEYSHELVADSRIEPGGCLIESDVGTVDARVQTRVDMVEKAIQEVIADESDERP